MNTLSRSAGTAIIVALVASCATGRHAAPVRHCSGPGIHVDAQFEGGAFHRCTVSGDGKVLIELRPEDEPINPSPWYAFRVSSTKDKSATTVTIDHGDYRARYWPKLSRDGRHWTPAAPAAVRTDGNRHVLRLDTAQTPVWVAGQELRLADWYDGWLNELRAHPAFEVQLLGSSVEGRPIHVATGGDSKDYVLLLGRQHPPEITGALAMRPFVASIMADTGLARRFRERYRIVIIPFLNPDGVARGHWRHNVNGVDLNRDWGPFTQPETRSAAALLDALDQEGARPHLMLDFHSTRRSLFYTQMPADFAGEPDFASVWLERSRVRLPDYEFSYEPRPTSSQANSKNYFYGRYGIPAITYELGDETPRAMIDRSSVVFAEEMMKLLLEAP